MHSLLILGPGVSSITHYSDLSDAFEAMDLVAGHVDADRFRVVLTTAFGNSVSWGKGK